MNKIDSVWAEEAGKQACFERMDNGRVRITVFENYASNDQRIEAVVTLSNWRWDRIIEAMKLPPAPTLPERQER